MLNKLGMVFLAVGTLWGAESAHAASEAALDVVPSVDLNRYAGKWYEIARLPNRFQRDCAGNTTPTYTLRPDGKISVLNECRKADGRQKSAKGTARVADAKGPNTKLKVTFLLAVRWQVLDHRSRSGVSVGSGRRAHQGLSLDSQPGTPVGSGALRTDRRARETARI